MDELSAETLDEIERRATAATPGPWTSHIEGRDGLGFDSVITTSNEDIYLTGATHADQDFIAAARLDVPALLAEVRRLKQERSGKASGPYACSFCGKINKQVQWLVNHIGIGANGQTLDATVCDECIGLHLEVLAQQKPALFNKLATAAKNAASEKPLNEGDEQ